MNDRHEVKSQFLSSPIQDSQNDDNDSSLTDGDDDSFPITNNDNDSSISNDRSLPNLISHYQDDVVIANSEAEGTQIARLNLQQNYNSLHW